LASERFNASTFANATSPEQLDDSPLALKLLSLASITPACAEFSHFLLHLKMVIGMPV
jgi:hypothetical protein